MAIKKKPTSKITKEKKVLEVDREIELEYSEDKLSAKQELFCQTFATKGGLFGNWVQTYIEVYSPDQGKTNWYKTACSSASQILSNIKVTKRINELLESEGLNEVEVDKQHKYLIEQHSDLWVKMRAIAEFNKLKGRIEEKLKVTWSLSLTDLHERSQNPDPSIEPKA